MFDPNCYTVALICAIEVEYVAAQESLDEEYDRPTSAAPNDPNDYTLGRIREHNVVIATLPDGEYGTSSAATVATHLLRTFRNVRIGLMVGIAGGVPTQHDIRLGDIVVSSPRDGMGGVLEYDFGKTVQCRSFQHTRFLDQPPQVLRSAVAGIRSQYKRKGHRLREMVNQILDGNPNLRDDYGRPPAGTDILFTSETVHGSRPCATSCARFVGNKIQRRERSNNESDPKIHFGLIASGTQLMKDAWIRDALAVKKDVLCFEMEAAGLMNTLPCLVIRGICDYSDSHKNKEWQGYAALMAAAFAKDILYRIPVTRDEGERKAVDALSESHRDTVQQNLALQERKAQQELSEEQKECLQMFRLTQSGKDATYEWYKDRVDKRVEGTCEWFIRHDNFQRWLKKDSGVLLVSADPGCGKTVLAKYLIDKYLSDAATVCYFFFKDHDQDTVRQALCALIHQLISQIPSLVEHTMKEFRAEGSALVNSTGQLWSILSRAAQDPRAGSVIIVLDALDECTEKELEVLVQLVEGQFSHSSQLSKLRYLLTSRPYDQILGNFRGLSDTFPLIHIPGENESEVISAEVNLVIQHRLDRLAREKNLSKPLKTHLGEKLFQIQHRTYLWVYLVFDYLKKEPFKKTAAGIISAIATLPETVYEAYEQILNKSKNDPMVRKALSVILIATRPLTLAEMNVALSVDVEMKSMADLDLEEDEDFKIRLRDLCGLFVSVHNGKVGFLHQTAREFLCADVLSPASTSRWQHSITAQQAHMTLAETCVTYLDFLNNEIFPPELIARRCCICSFRNWGDFFRDISGKIPSQDPCEIYNGGSGQYIFLNYCTENWALHYREANIDGNANIVSSTLRICDTSSSSFPVWFSLFLFRRIESDAVRDWTNLMVSSYFGQESIVRLHLEQGCDIHARNEDGMTPLAIAADRRHESILKLLLEHGSDVNSKGKWGWTPLERAAESGNEAIAKLLLEYGANVDSMDDSGWTPLAKAATSGHEPIFKLLLQQRPDAHSRKENGWSPLAVAASSGCDAIVKLLLELGSDVHSRDEEGWTPLARAAEKGHETIVSLLLKHGSDAHSKDNAGCTPLSRAIDHGREATIRLLLAYGSDIHLRDERGWTLLARAAEEGHETIVSILLERGSDVHSKDNEGWTPLLRAVDYRREATIRLLLEHGSDVNLKDETLGRTPLAHVAVSGHETIARLLIEHGSEVNSRDNSGETPLTLAVLCGHEAIVKMLLEGGSDVHSQDNNGRTPLKVALLKKHEAIIKLLKQHSDVHPKCQE
ncbi:hypothetical protein N7492_005826 [Penicillium capsulatum]|uniref:NACHT domain-containing protein n=1 Tax=Penicillium capsulatum TaxID=69766 RepID=A0A9W9ICK7_9EURO|nr:hypothetical protein N7492_005826 [Penicillium capsulatum]